MKYYVKSNEFEFVVAGPHVTTARQAAIEAFLTHYDKQFLSPLIIVSERGFEYHSHDYTEDKVFDTCEILKEAGFTFEDG